MLRRKALLCWWLIAAVSFTLISCGSQVEVGPPVAKIEPKVDLLFGQERMDNYYWLRERGNPEVIAYLEAENEYTEAKMKHTQKLQDKLYDELVSRIKETDLSVPVKWGDFYYYSRTEEGKQYKIYCRKMGSLEAEEEILFDVNKLAEGKDYYYLGVQQISPNHKLVAYAFDTTGGERYTMRVKDLETGELLPDVIDSISRSVEWANPTTTRPSFTPWLTKPGVPISCSVTPWERKQKTMS
jgi:oligopeptidase B